MISNWFNKNERNVLPFHQSCMWSAAALAADIADDSFRAAMTAAPRFWINWMNWSSCPPNATDLPLIKALLTSGNWVEEWFPQMMTRETSLTATLFLAANWLMARFWSKRVIAVKFLAGIVGAANLAAIRALVLAGLPTTKTFTLGFEWFLRAVPWLLNICSNNYN